jgi:hypothetical protein
MGGTIAQRTARIEKLLNTIKAASAQSKPVSREKLIAVSSLDFGVRRIIVEDYIDTLLKGEKIELEGKDDLWAIGKDEENTALTDGEKEILAAKQSEG